MMIIIIIYYVWDSMLGFLLFSCWSPFSSFLLLSLLVSVIHTFLIFAVATFLDIPTGAFSQSKQIVLTPSLIVLQCW